MDFNFNFKLTGGECQELPVNRFHIVVKLGRRWPTIEMGKQISMHHST